MAQKKKPAKKQSRYKYFNGGEFDQWGNPIGQPFQLNQGQPQFSPWQQPFQMGQQPPQMPQSQQPWVPPQEVEPGDYMTPRPTEGIQSMAFQPPEAAPAAPENLGEEPAQTTPSRSLNRGINQGVQAVGKALNTAITAGPALISALLPEQSKKRNTLDDYYAQNANPMGTGSQAIYQWGGGTRRQGNIQVTEDFTPAANTVAPIAPNVGTSLGPTQGVIDALKQPAYNPILGEVSQPIPINMGSQGQSKVTFGDGLDAEGNPIPVEPKRRRGIGKLFDRLGNVIGLEPTYQGGWNRREAVRDMQSLPATAQGLPIMRSPELYSELNRGFTPGSTSDQWGPYMRSGGGLSRSDDYGSKKKPYPSVDKSDFAGGGRSYPIPTRADAVDALRLAGLHGRDDVKAKVYAKYPDLRPDKKWEGGDIPQFQRGGRPINVPESGVVVDKRTNQMFVTRGGRPIYNTPVITGENVERNTNVYGLQDLEGSKNRYRRATPRGHYRLDPNPDELYGRKGYYDMEPIRGPQGQPKPDATFLAMHNTAYPKKRLPLYDKSAKDRAASFGCINCRKPDLDYLDRNVNPRDTLYVMDSANPQDAEALSYLQGGRGVRSTPEQMLSRTLLGSAGQPYRAPTQKQVGKRQNTVAKKAINRPASVPQASSASPSKPLAVAPTAHEAMDTPQFMSTREIHLDNPVETPVMVPASAPKSRSVEILDARGRPAGKFEFDTEQELRDYKAANKLRQRGASATSFVNPSINPYAYGGQVPRYQDGSEPISPEFGPEGMNPMFVQPQPVSPQYNPVGITPTFMQPDPTPAAVPITSTGAPVVPTTYSGSFKDAFRAARKQLGDGQIFEWRGKKYMTSLASSKERVKNAVPSKQRVSLAPPPPIQQRPIPNVAPNINHLFQPDYQGFYDTMAPELVPLRRGNYEWGGSTLPKYQEGSPSLGPMAYAQAYLNSPMYRQRLSNFSNNPDQAISEANQYLSQLNVTTNEGGSATNRDKRTINLDQGEAGSASVLYNQTYPHEISHYTRPLSVNEQTAIMAKNQLNPSVKYDRSDQSLTPEALYNQFERQAAKDPFESAYNWWNDVDYHEQNPAENKADLDALRYQMQKYNIYDTRTGNMTQEHYDKAMNHPKIKNTVNAKRLRKAFKPENLIWMNNTIAALPPNQVPTANFGMQIPGTTGYIAGKEYDITPEEAARLRELGYNFDIV